MSSDGPSPSVSPPPKRRRTKEEAAQAREAKARAHSDRIQERERNQAFKSGVKYKRPEGKRFDITPSDRVDEATWQVLDSLCPQRRVLLQYSTGKDSTAAWIELRERGYTVVPFFKETIPGLRMFDGPIAAHEDYFKQEIIIIPNKVTFFERYAFFNSPDDIAALGKEMRDFIELRNNSKSYIKKYRQSVVDTLMAENNCDVCIIGTKASDSLHRRTHFTVDGPYNASDRLFALLWRMKKSGPLQLMIEKKCPVPRYYLWLGRSPELTFEYEYAHIKRHCPEDWDMLKKVFKDVDVFVAKYEADPAPKHIVKPPKIAIEALEAGHVFV